MPDRVRNAVVKVERKAQSLPTPLRQLGMGSTARDQGIGLDNSGRTTKPIVALTFDDGPDPVVTPAVLDLLAERRATATFFMLSERAEQYPEIARARGRRGPRGSPAWGEPRQLDSSWQPSGG